MIIKEKLVGEYTDPYDGKVRAIMMCLFACDIEREDDWWRCEGVEEEEDAPHAILSGKIDEDGEMTTDGLQLELNSVEDRVYFMDEIKIIECV